MDLTRRLSGAAVLAGIVILVAAAFRWDDMAGMVALGLALVIVGVEVPKR